MTTKCILAQFKVRSVNLDRVKAAQRRDPQLQKISFEVQQGQSRYFMMNNEDTLRLGTRLCVPGIGELRKEIMEKNSFFLLTVFIQVLPRCVMI